MRGCLLKKSGFRLGRDARSAGCACCVDLAFFYFSRSSIKTVESWFMSDRPRRRITIWYGMRSQYERNQKRHAKSSGRGRWESASLSRSLRNVGSGLEAGQAFCCFVVVFIMYELICVSLGLPHTVLWPSSISLSMLLLVRLLALHDPSTSFLSILLRLLLGSHDSLQLKLVGDVDSLLNSGTGVDDLHPLLNGRKRLGLDASPGTPIYPGEGGNVCNGELVTHQPETLTSLFLLFQAVVQDLV